MSSTIHIGSSRLKTVARKGLIVHNGEPFAVRLDGDKLEFSTIADRRTLVEAAVLVGAELEARRHASGGIKVPINPVGMKAFCVGVYERALSGDATG